MIPLLPDAKRTELIKRGFDKMAFMGVVFLCVFLAFPKIDWDRFGDLQPGWMLAVMVGCLAPLLLLLLWIEEKIRSRKIRWTIGCLAWVGTFALALSGYLLP